MYVRETMPLWLREGELQQRPQFIFAILPIIPRITAENKEIMALFLSSAERDWLHFILLYSFRRLKPKSYDYVFTPKYRYMNKSVNKNDHLLQGRC